MTVGELIVELMKLDKDATVIVGGGEMTYHNNEVSHIEEGVLHREWCPEEEAMMFYPKNRAWRGAEKCVLLQ